MAIGCVNVSFYFRRYITKSANALAYRASGME